MPNFRKRIPFSGRLRLKELRQAKGYRQAQEFAKALGVSRSELSRWETGRVWPTLQMSLHIAGTLKVKVEELVEFPSEPGPKKAPKKKEKPK